MVVVSSVPGVRGVRLAEEAGIPARVLRRSDFGSDGAYSEAVYAAIAPEAALESNFGESLDGPVADVVVRNWGVLIGLIGAMLIYAARHPALRPMTLTVAGASKAVFIALVLSHGRAFLGGQAGIAVLVDAIWVVVFAAYLVSTRGSLATNAAAAVERV